MLIFIQFDLFDANMNIINMHSVYNPICSDI